LGEARYSSGDQQQPAGNQLRQPSDFQHAGISSDLFL